MKASNTKIGKVIENITTKITLENGKTFLMCGEIVNNNLIRSSITPSFHQLTRFNKLPDEIKRTLIQTTYREFKKF